MIHIWEIPRVVKINETISIKMVVAGDWRSGIGSYCLMNTEFQLEVKKNVLEMDGVDGCTKL